MFFPIIEAIHVMGLAFSVGAIVIADLWLLGFGTRDQSAANALASSLAFWTWAGFAVMLATGAALFFSNVHRYVHNSGFLAKMILLALALLAHFTVHRKAVRAGHGRAAAILSLILWSSVVISAKAIADLDV